MNPAHENFVEQAIPLIISGAAVPDIWRKLAENGFSGSLRTMERIVAKAMKVIIKAQEKKREFITARATARHELLFSLALSKGDIKTALAVERSLLELAGVIGVHAGAGDDEPEKVRRIVFVRAVDPRVTTDPSPSSPADPAH